MEATRISDRLAVLRCELSALRAGLAQEGQDTVIADEMEELLNRLAEELEAQVR